jgi:hypothetical protein
MHRRGASHYLPDHRGTFTVAPAQTREGERLMSTATIIAVSDAIIAASR